MDACCHIEMLGQLRVVLPHQTLTRFPTQKAGTLLAYMALRAGRLSPREHLLDLFWGDMDLAAGRDNLSTTLSALRRILEPPGVPRGTVLSADRSQIGLNADAVTTDVAQFERLLDQAKGVADRPKRIDLRARAAGLYGGDFLPGCYLDWAVRESERLQSLHLASLGAWTQDLEQSGEAEAAREAARRWADADPYSEDAQTALIRLLIQTGRQEAAREAFARLERMLQDEFGTSPSSDVQKLMVGLPGSAAGPAKSAAQKRAKPEAAAAASETEPPAIHVEKVGPRPAALPASLSRFFGREAELALLARLLLPSKDAPFERAEEPARLVTLTGPGGMGKTRLATEFTRQVAERFGLWSGFVPLAEISAADQILPHLVSVLRLTSAPDAVPLDQAAGFFATLDAPGATPALLVLDNLEQIADAGAVIASLLERVPNLVCLCTSRRRLGLRGERLLPLAPLAVPETTPDPVDLLTYPSVRLYTDRAQAVRPDFQITPGNAEAVARLCRALEGSPLALELAASWVRSLPPRKMWERLARDLGGGIAALEARYADLPSRHRSLWAALDWSFRLLSPGQQRLFARLSVFRGGWTEEDAAAVCDEPEAWRLLAALQEGSLVIVTETEDGEVRWRFLETVRQYAHDRLRETGDAPDMSRRHRNYFIALTEQAYTARQTPEAGAWLSRLETEHDNLRAALDDSLAAPDGVGDGVRLAGALWWFWLARGHLSEGRARLATTLARTEDATDDRAATALRARALRGAGLLAQEQSDLQDAERLHTESLSLSRRLGDAQGMAHSLNNLGNVAFLRGDMPATLALYEESLALHRQVGNNWGAATTLGNLGGVLLNLGDMPGGRARYEESLKLARELGDDEGVAWTLGCLSGVANFQGDEAAARRMAEESLALYRVLGSRDASVVTTLLTLSSLALRQERLEDAAAYLADGLTLCGQIGAKLAGVGLLEGAARLARQRGRLSCAARLLGANEALRVALGAPREAVDRQTHDADVGCTREALGEEAFTSSWAAGQTLSWEEAIAEALAEAKTQQV